MEEKELFERLRRVRLVGLDVDGVLTDGRIVYGDHGDEIKFFDVRDGHGIALLHKAQIPVVFISSRKSRVNARRAKELRVSKAYQGVSDKSKVFAKVLKKHKVPAEDACFIGDDLPDLAVLRQCGFSATVADAADDVKAAVHYVARRKGGRGAVREVADMILKAQGRWHDAALK